MKLKHFLKYIIWSSNHLYLLLRLIIIFSNHSSMSWWMSSIQLSTFLKLGAILYDFSITIKTPKPGIKSE